MPSPTAIGSRTVEAISVRRPACPARNGETVSWIWRKAAPVLLAAADG